MLCFRQLCIKNVFKPKSTHDPNPNKPTDSPKPTHQPNPNKLLQSQVKRQSQRMSLIPINRLRIRPNSKPTHLPNPNQPADTPKPTQDAASSPKPIETPKPTHELNPNKPTPSPTTESTPSQLSFPTPAPLPSQPKFKISDDMCFKF